MTLKIEHRLPTPETFRKLRSGVSWGTPSVEHARAALAGSLTAVCAVQNGETIGMARAVGDGVLNIYIQDVIVSGEFQNQGIGQQLIQALIGSLNETCPADCLIGLFAADGQDGFYTQFGFTSRPQSGFGPGMHAKLSALAKAIGGA